MTVDEFSRLIQNPNSVRAKHEADLKEIVDFYPYFSHAKLLYLKALQESKSLLFESRIASTTLYASDRESLYFYLYPEKQLSKTPETYTREERFSGSYFDMLEMTGIEGGGSPISLKEIAEQLKASRRLLTEQESSKELEEIQEGPSVEKLLSIEPEIIINDLPATILKESSLVAEVSSSETKQKQEEKNETKDFSISKEEKPYIPVLDYFKEEDPTKNMSLEEKSKWYIKQKKYPEAIKILKQLYLINPKKSIYFADQIRFLERIISKTT